MNKEIFDGKWHEVKGKIKEKWGKLTDDDLTEIDGKKEALLGKLQSRYGYAKERAEKELEEYEHSGSSKTDKHSKL
ncbi:MAG: CsbD family protein [Parachlamydiaceae bacterium]|nr:CsbD family protein [Parachlamydiaceae bacterium]